MTIKNEEEEARVIENQFTTIYRYIEENEEEKRPKKVGTVKGDIAVFALNVIHNHINQSKEEKDLVSEEKDLVPKNEQIKSLTQSQNLIIEACDEVKAMLLDKNRKYGDSALNPQRIFSKANTIEQINVRMDDKLSRIKNMVQNNIEDKSESINDSIKDLVGYLILHMVHNHDK